MHKWTKFVRSTRCGVPTNKNSFGYLDPSEEYESTRIGNGEHNSAGDCVTKHARLNGGKQMVKWAA